MARLSLHWYNLSLTVSMGCAIAIGGITRVVCWQQCEHTHPLGGFCSTPLLQPESFLQEGVMDSSIEVPLPLCLCSLRGRRAVSLGVHASLLIAFNALGSLGRGGGCLGSTAYDLVLRL